MMRTRFVRVAAAVFALIGSNTMGAAAADSSDIARQAEADYAQVAKTVAHAGFACIPYDEASGAGEHFSYTVGLTSKGLPEIMIFTDQSGAEQCAQLESVVPWMLKHRDVLHHNAVVRKDVRLQPVYPAEFFEHCPLAAVWVARHHISSAYGMQMVFADDHGAFPN